MSQKAVDEVASETLIDAEFEPVNPPKQPKVRRGPGWFSFLFMTLVSIAALGLHLVPDTLDAPSREDFVSTAQIAPIEANLGVVEAEQADLAATLQSVQTTLTEFDADNVSIAALESRIVEIERQLEAMTSQVVAAARDETPSTNDPVRQNEINLGPIEARLETLESRLGAAINSATATPENIADLESRLETLSGTLTALQNRISAVEDAVANLPEPDDVIGRAEAALAFAALDDAARRGTSFTTAQARLSSARPDDVDVLALAAMASTPPPSWNRLRQDFERQAAEAEALQTASDTPGWFQNLVGDGIRVRRTDAQSAASQFADAKRALDGDTPSDAIAIISALDPQIQAPFTVWLQQAKARQSMDVTLDRLRQALLFEDNP